MRDDEPFRRFLITVGITTGLPETGSRISESVDRMTRVFTGTFGYERVTPLDIDPALEQIRKQIREFCLKCEEDAVVALYYTGHADEVNGKHRVWTGNTADPVLGTLETGHLAELMLVGTRLRYALIILDTCFAGQGGAEALQASLAGAAEGDGKILAVMTAAYPREQIQAGDFAELFERAVQQRAVAGHEPPYLTLGAITRFIDADPGRPGWQTVSQSVLLARTDELPFFPNKRYNVQLHGLDLLTQLRIEQRELRVEEMRGHFLPRARGVDVPAEAGWRFVGREAALRDLVSWLRDPKDLSVRVVTGGPGSGKSAVIGRLVVLSDGDWRRTVPMDELAADTIPPEGAIATGIHARGMTTAQVLAAVCAAVGSRADTPADLLREMRGRRLTIAIDAIDEALDPPGLVSAILRPLVEAGPAEGLRLLLGTRPHLVAWLGPIAAAVDLDDERYADPASLYQYVLRSLADQSPRSPYRAAPRETVESVARAVADAAGLSFLVALIVSRTLSSSDEVPDPEDSVWRASLPASAADAMHQDLQTRLGAEAHRARELLRPLAFAFGAGLPWDTVWAGLSTRLSGHLYTNDDLMWVWRQAGSYVVEAKESGHSVYRLYHAALAEYLRHSRDEARVHRQFYDFLVGGVPTSRSGPDWSRAHPYTRAHVATHAQQAGTLDDLLLDPRYLVNAMPTGLLAALPAARAADAELAGAAYQRAVHQFRNQAEEHRFSYLELASRIVGAGELARRLAAEAPDRRWSVPWTQWPPEYPHRVLDGHLGLLNDVVCAEFSDGNTIVASAGADARLRLWDAVTAEPRGSYAVGNAPLVAIRAVRVPGNRTVLVLLAADGTLCTWDVATAVPLWSVTVVPRWRRGIGLRNAAFTLRCLSTPDGRQFAVAGGRGRGIRTSIWEVSSGRSVAVLPSATSPHGIEFTELPDGEVAILASEGAGYRVYDSETGRVLPGRRSARFRRVVYYGQSGYPPPLVAVRFSRTKAELWDVATGEPLGTWERGAPVEVRLADGRTVTVPLPARKIPGTRAESVTDAGGLVPLTTQLHRRQSADEPSFPRVEVHGRFLSVALQPGAGELTLAGHTADITGYDRTRLPGGDEVIVSVSRDGTVRRWDVSAPPRYAEERRESAVAVHRVVSAPLADGTPLGVTIADDASVALWDLHTGRRAGVLNGGAAPPAVIAAAPAAEGSDPVAVSFDTDQAWRVWSLPAGDQVTEHPADRHRWPSDVALARLPDGTRLAVTSGHGRRAVVWELATGQMRDVLTGHRAWSACVTCAEGRGGTLALTAGLDNRIAVWDLRRRRRRAQFRIVPPWTYLARPPAGQAHVIRAVALPGGQVLLLVATADCMVRSLVPRGVLRGVRRVATVSGDAVGIVRLSDDRKVVVTAARDGIVRIWALEAFTRQPSDDSLLCEINIEVPVSDIASTGDGAFVIATPNGLTAIRLDAGLLERRIRRVSGVPEGESMPVPGLLRSR